MSDVQLVETRGRPDRYASPPEGELNCLKAFIGCVEVFRSVQPDIPSSWVHAFLTVAMEPGYGPSEYARRCGALAPVMSRILLELGVKNTRNGGKGLGLIGRKPHEDHERQWRYFLTPKGKDLYRKLLTHLK